MADDLHGCARIHAAYGNRLYAGAGDRRSPLHGVARDRRDRQNDQWLITTPKILAQASCESLNHLFVILVVNLTTHDVLEDILHRDDSSERSMLIHDGVEMFPLLKHLQQQLISAHQLRHRNQRTL